MLSAKELKDYRLLRNLSLRDVARYCNVSAQMIGSVERYEYTLTESTYREIVKGINTAYQAMINGTFDKDKAQEREEVKRKQEVKAAANTETAATTTKRKTKTSAKTAGSDKT